MIDANTVWMMVGVNLDKFTDAIAEWLNSEKDTDIPVTFLCFFEDTKESAMAKAAIHHEDLEIIGIWQLADVIENQLTS
jgi:hypothetical protein